MARTRSDLTLDRAVRFTGALELAREWRDREITNAHLDGWSLREIGRAVGLSHTGVARIVRQTLARETEDDDDA